MPALGTRCGLVTPFTSLMVLESLEQYVQRHIEPPTTLPGAPRRRTSGGSPRKSGGRGRGEAGGAGRRNAAAGR